MGLQQPTSTDSRDAPARVENRLEALERRLATLEAQAAEDRVSLVVFSGELDRVLAAFVIATGAASMGMNVSMFFTFWGLAALRRKKVFRGKRWNEAMLALMTPGSTRSLPTSKLNFFGAGAVLLRRMMKEKDISSLEDLMALAREMGVRVVGCTMSMDAMGITREELMDGIELGGVATFLGDATRSRASLFI